MLKQTIMISFHHIHLALLAVGRHKKAITSRTSKYWMCHSAFHTQFDCQSWSRSKDILTSLKRNRIGGRLDLQKDQRGGIAYIFTNVRRAERRAATSNVPSKYLYMCSFNVWFLLESCAMVLKREKQMYSAVKVRAKNNHRLRKWKRKGRKDIHQ